jgi:hypothetical protein
VTPTASPKQKGDKNPKLLTTTIEKEKVNTEKKKTGKQHHRRVVAT